MINWDQEEVFSKLVALPNIPFLNFAKSVFFDFSLNCLRKKEYNDNDERTSFCEMFIPIFKAFANTMTNSSFS
jgi:hypothetical protein